MGWLNLGTVIPVFEWRDFDVAAVNTELFRITQSWNGDFPGVGPIQLRSVYPNGGQMGFRQFFQNTEPLLFVMPTPPELANAGYLIRDLQIRLGGRTRVYEDALWRITIETWTGQVDGASPVQRVSGGTYDGV